MGTTIRYAAIALAILAGIAGIAIGLWGEFPGLEKVGLAQTKSVAWGLPVLAFASACSFIKYPRTGATIALLAWAVAMLSLLGGGFSVTLAAFIVLTLLAAGTSLYSIVAVGDEIGRPNVRHGETVRPDWVTRFRRPRSPRSRCSSWCSACSSAARSGRSCFPSPTRPGTRPIEFVGWKQYERLLFRTPRWSISVKNLAVYGVCSLTFSFVIGFLLAVFMDQKIRFESAFRTIYLYPFALSFIVTGHVWAWIMNPNLGLQKAVRDLGWTSFTFDWLGDRNMVIYALVIAGLWQGTGLIMALMLAGLRGIDEEVWKAARVDGIPKWRTYLSIVIPMMRPVLITTLVIAASGVVRVYDLVVALTAGGPGSFSEVPAKYVYDYMFQGNLAQGLAASTVMLLTVGIIIIPWAHRRIRRQAQA